MTVAVSLIWKASRVNHTVTGLQDGQCVAPQLEELLQIEVRKFLRIQLSTKAWIERWTASLLRDGCAESAVAELLAVEET